MWSLATAIPSPARRPRVIRLAREFGYDHRVGPSPILPLMPIAEILSDVPIRLREPISVDGNVSLLELAVLNTLVASRRPLSLFEIGTFDGRTTLNLAANAPAGAVVHTLDLPAADEPALQVHRDDTAFIRRSQAGMRGTRFRNTAEQSKIIQLEGDSATFDYSRFRGAVDFVLVDGAHSFEYVLSDSLNALALARSQAVIAWHDYGEWPEVTQALNQLYETDPRFSGLRHIEHTTITLLAT